MSEKIGYGQALADLRATAAGREDFIYRVPVEGEGCLYVHTSYDYENEKTVFAPGCIVGTMLLNQGVEPVTFLDLRINKKTGSVSAVSRLVENGYHPGYTDKATYLISEVQSNQDNESPWGQSIERAIESLSEMYIFDSEENFVDYK